MNILHFNLKHLKSWSHNNFEELKMSPTCKGKCQFHLLSKSNIFHSPLYPPPSFNPKQHFHHLDRQTAEEQHLL